MAAYESDLDAWRDFESSLDTKYLDGMEMGIEKGIEIGLADKEKYAEDRERNISLDIARKMLGSGMGISQVCVLTGLSEEIIEKLK